VYDGQVQVIIDRAQTLKDAKELALQIENGSFSKDSVILLDELLSGAKKPNNEKPIIYRSTGAPMQSLAILQLMA
jgi:ornithine cyclodeaminase/alanine dehydrogenase-like protein (mu-crystallin family)